jgi:hypothetical protein
MAAASVTTLRRLGRVRFITSLLATLVFLLLLVFRNAAFADRLRYVAYACLAAWAVCLVAEWVTRLASGERPPVDPPAGGARR